MRNTGILTAPGDITKASEATCAIQGVPCGTALLNRVLSTMAANSQENYKTAVRQFEEYAGKGLLECKTGDLVGYFEHIRRRYSNSTVNNKMSALSSVYSKAHALGMIEDNPVEIMRKIKRTTLKVVKESRASDLTLEDIEKVVAHTKDPRVKLFLRLLTCTGMRESEALSILRRNIKIEKDIVSVRIVGKGSKERAIYIPLEMYNDILRVFGREGEYLFTHKRGKPYVRKTLYQWVNQAFYDVLHLEVSPHKLRHFFATEKIVREKKDVKGVSLYLGHSTTAITMDMYVDSKLSPEEAMIPMLRSEPSAAVRGSFRVR